LDEDEMILNRKGRPMKRVTTVLIALAVLAIGFKPSVPDASSQGRQVDVVRTEKGELKITPIVHASLMLEFQGKVIYVDPTSEGNYTGLPKADFILITHTHRDHMDRATVDQLKRPSTVILAPAAVAQTITEAQVIAYGQTKRMDGIKVEAVPMYNLVHGPSPGRVYHTKGEGNGYLLTVDSKRVYIAGDTECVPEVKALKSIDVAFVPVNLPFTMSPEEAAECIKAFRPRIVYPYHFRGSNLNILTNALKAEGGIEVRIRKWY